jgi:hypothetical protein
VPFIGGNSRRTTPSSSAAARILAETLRQSGNCAVTNKFAALRRLVTATAFGQSCLCGDLTTGFEEGRHASNQSQNR